MYQQDQGSLFQHLFDTRIVNNKRGKGRDDASVKMPSKNTYSRREITKEKGLALNTLVDNRSFPPAAFGGKCRVRVPGGQRGT